MTIAGRCRWGVSAVAIALAAAAVPIAAQPAPSIDRELLAQVEREQRQRVGGVLALFGVTLGYPSRASGSVAALVYSMPASYDCRHLCRFQGLLLRAEPGLRAGRIGVGFARVYGGTAGRSHRLRRTELGLAIEGSLLRTWEGAPLTPPSQSFAGVSAQLTVVGVRFNAGLYRRVSPGPTREPWLLSAGFGWGF